MLIHLSPAYQFTIEEDAGKKRLIIFKDGDEVVCHKESLGNLLAFSNSDFAHLFKGRLQLIKTKSSIYFQVKGEVVGEMTAGNFQQFLEHP
jgi:hypothetical protein